MKHDNDVLTRDDLITITGYAVAKLQAERLRESGVWFIEDKEGTPKTTWYHINHPLKFRADMRSTPTEPDWEAINGPTT
ncbi:TPA: DUF4224 domain-containing protein [Salmonella enterica]|nr:DUF4224 domain-containing protein [Salmonella enterica]EEE3048876.1 DUF4224 domain-containing protein [Salmonella enterica subsp. enterica serovar Duisburg]EAX2707060.1 DUF4224 domain-containing protein [Salmonella enterica]EBJ0585891.1 hypothetical protein [Salmonella enterica]EBQ0838011.1 DUF4224 domain-containing protein [Salmonella enterica]